MHVSRLVIGDVSVPLLRPFKTVLRTVTSIDDTLIRLETDTGLVGWGEAPATPVITGDTRGGILDGLVIAAKAIEGLHLIDDWDAVQTRLANCMVHNTSAKAAIDIALHDLVAQAAGKPVYDWLGGRVRDHLVTDLTISVGDVDAMIEESVEGVERGFDTLKVKVGTDAELDIVRLTEIRNAVGPDVALRLDANQGWTADEAIRVITALEDAGIIAELVEQPVRAHDFDGLKRVTDNVTTPILADEAVFSAHDAERILRERAADLINIKLMKTGGIHQARKIVALAEQAGVECMLGAMMETAVSITAAAHLAMTAPCITMIDLDPPLLCSENPVQGGMVWDGAVITLPDTPGLGITDVEGARFA